MKKILKMIFLYKKAILIVIGTILFMYGALIITNALDNNTQKMIDRVRSEKIEKGLKMAEMKAEYNSCIDKVAVNYVWAGNHVCKDKGLGDNCPLESYNSDILNNALAKDKSNCLSIYEIGMNTISQTGNRNIMELGEN